jgi:hypothetical protein
LTPIAAMVVEMIARGVDPEVIAIAVSAAEQAVAMSMCPQNSADISADKRRERDRLRKRAVRGIPQTSAEIPRNSADTENAPLSIERKKEEKEERKRETTRGARLPVGWTPTPQDLAVADELLGEQKSRSELEKFRAQQPGQRGIKLDWNAAWRNWARRAAEYSVPRNSAHKPLTQHQIERQESREILDGLQKFINDDGRSGSDANPGLLRFDPGDGQESFHGRFRRNVVDIPLGGGRKGD